MLEKIQHINPKEITDLAQLQNLMIVFMNILESQAKRIDDLDKENQELKNEKQLINRLVVKIFNGNFKKSKIREKEKKIAEKHPTSSRHLKHLSNHIYSNRNIILLNNQILKSMGKANLKLFVYLSQLE